MKVRNEFGERKNAEKVATLSLVVMNEELKKNIRMAEDIQLYGVCSDSGMRKII